jgi:CRISPR-associated endoribonuclease Cas6
LPAFGSQEFATYLNDIGFELNRKKYKLFTFCLSLKQFRIEKDIFILLNPDMDLFISSPKIDDFIHNFVIGSFEKQEIIIHNNLANYKFKINQVESFPDPDFKESMKFNMLSPMVFSTKVDTVDGNKTQYLRYDDEHYENNRILTRNLINRYFLLTNQQDTSDDLRLE